MDSIPAIITAIGFVLTAVGSIIAARRSGRVEAKVNGTAHDMEADRKALLERVDTLKDQLARLVVERQDERAASQKAASDVQAAIAAPPKEPG